MNIQRFRASFGKRVQRSTSGCWEWTGKKRLNGYGVLFISISAHRLAYELFKGEIPNGMVICHSCDVRTCVNPDHLFCGTTKENAQDMVRKGRCRPHNAVKKMCPSGHLYSGENLRLGKRGGRWSYRVCKTCARRNNANYKARLKAKAKEA